MTATLQAHPPLSALLAAALDQAQPALRASVDGHLGCCEQCRVRFCELRSDLAQLTLALEPSPVPPMLREGIMQAAGEIHRLFDAAEPLARVLQISRRKAHGILLRLDAPRHWQHTARGWQLLLPESRLRGAHILRLQAGETLPCPAQAASCASNLRVLMVLQGHACDASGRAFTAGVSLELTASRPLAPTGDLLVQQGADFLVLLSEAAEVKRRRARALQVPHEVSVSQH